MKLSERVLNIYEEISGKPVNYTVRATLKFDDGENTGNVKVKAVSREDAEKVAREQLNKRWSSVGLKGIDIVSIKKG